MRLNAIYLFTIFLFIGFKSISQVDSLDDNTYNETRFSIQTGNNIVQIGQVMSNSEIYIRPSINFYHKSGIYVGGNLTIMPTDTQKYIDNYSLSLGYDYEFGEYISAGIDYTFSQYYTTKQVTSSANHIVRPYISWENKYITPTCTPSILFGSNIDFAMQLDFSHIFILKLKKQPYSKITIPISVGINSGTSEYYNTYRIGRRGRQQGTIDSVANTRYDLTSIYGLIGVKYKIRKSSISLNTSYYLTRDEYSNSLISNPLILRLTAAYNL